MSGTICTDNGGATLKVRDCSDLGAKDANDTYNAFCKITSGPDTGKVVDKTGTVAKYDPSTSSTDVNNGILYFANPNGGLRVGVSGLTVAEQIATTGAQGQNLTSFELCEIGANPFKTLITYTDGRTAEIDVSQKNKKGQLIFFSPDGKSTRIVSGLSDEQIKLVTDMQGAEIGSCNSAKGAGISYALLPTRTAAGETVSWGLKDLDYFKSKLGGTSNRVFFCANDAYVELGGSEPATTIAVNMGDGYQSIVRTLLKAMADEECSMEGDKCDIASEALGEQFKSNFPFSDPIKSWGDLFKEYGQYGFGALILGFITGIGFALTGRWFGGHGGGGLTASKGAATSESNASTNSQESLKKFQELSAAGAAPLPEVEKIDSKGTSASRVQIAIPAIVPMPVPVIAVP